MPAASAQTQALPQDFFTMNGNSLKTASPLRDLHLANVAATGVTAVRADILWNLVENTPPVADASAPGGLRRTFDWRDSDQFIAALSRANLTWRPVFGNNPYWNRPAGGTFTTAPADPTLASGVASALLARYGVNGSFWAANPSLTAKPVRWIEAWNEPNMAPSNNSVYRYPPAGYARFLRAVSEGAHSVDPGAQVVVAGLVPYFTSTTKGLSIQDFLTQVAAAEPTVAGMTQGVAVHIYGSKVADAYFSLGRFRDQVVSTAFKYAKLHLNETGSSVKPADVVLGEPTRAAFLEGMAKQTAAASGPACNMGSIAPYTWTTSETDALNAEHWFGIANLDGTLRLSVTKFTAGIAAAVAGNATCGTLPVPAAPAAPAPTPVATPVATATPKSKRRG